MVISQAEHTVPPSDQHLIMFNICILDIYISIQHYYYHIQYSSSSYYYYLIMLKYT